MSAGCQEGTRGDCCDVVRQLELELQGCRISGSTINPSIQPPGCAPTHAPMAIQLQSTRLDGHAGAQAIHQQHQ